MVAQRPGSLVEIGFRLRPSMMRIAETPLYTGVYGGKGFCKYQF